MRALFPTATFLFPPSTRRGQHIRSRHLFREKCVNETRHIGNATIYRGNCLEILPSVQRAALVLADPPYEDHMHAAKRGIKIKGSARRIRIDGHANPPPVDFTSITHIRDEAAATMVRASEGWLLAFCTPEGVAPWRDAIEAAQARYKRACVWVKPDSAPQFNGQGPAMGAEMFVAAWCGSGHSRWNGGGRRNVFTHPCNPPSREGTHPTEKPVSLMIELIELFSDPEDTVIDPFMGSGTTGVACAKLGRKFIGIEIDPRYFDIACRRIEAAYKQPDLFVAPPAKLVQADLLAQSREAQS